MPRPSAYRCGNRGDLMMLMAVCEPVNHRSAFTQSLGRCVVAERPSLPRVERVEELRELIGSSPIVIPLVEDLGWDHRPSGGLMSSDVINVLVAQHASGRLDEVEVVGGGYESLFCGDQLVAGRASVPETATVEASFGVGDGVAGVSRRAFGGGERGAVRFVRCGRPAECCFAFVELLASLVAGADRFTSSIQLVTCPRLNVGPGGRDLRSRPWRLRRRLCRRRLRQAPTTGTGGQLSVACRVERLRRRPR